MVVLSSSLLLLLLLLINYSVSFSAKSSDGKQQQQPPPSKPLEPPFPNGPCGGSVITLSEEDTFRIDPKVNTLLLPPRPINVWVPPGYDDSQNQNTHYPLLFCHDGQNAMLDSDSWTGASWRMMGAITRLHERGLFRTESPIVVLLPSSDTDLIPTVVQRRHLEYGDGGAFAEEHQEFLVRTVKPLVEQRFRCSGETYAIGSSLGGQASLQLVLRYPNLFHGAACLSPAFQLNSFVSVIASSFPSPSPHPLRNKRLYLDIGGDVGDTKVPLFDPFDHFTKEHWWNPGYWWLDSQLQPTVRAMTLALDLAGADYQFQQFPGGRHNERAWAQRIDLPLLHLFGK